MMAKVRRFSTARARGEESSIVSEPFDTLAHPALQSAPPLRCGYFGRVRAKRGGPPATMTYVRNVARAPWRVSKNSRSSATKKYAGGGT